MSTDAHALNEQLKATAAAYNGSNPTGNSDADVAAQAAAHELNQHQGSTTHAGQHEVRADTPEEAAAAEAKKVADAAEAETKKVADEAAKKVADETPEAKVAREAAEAAAAVAVEETPEAKELREKTEAATAKEVADATEWMTTDSKEFNAAINMMKAAGMTPAEAATIFDEAAQTGDLSKVDEVALVAKVGADKAALIMGGFGTYVQTEGQALLARVKTVHDAVGGTDNWSKMTVWARGKAAGDTTFRGKVEGITAMMNGDNPMAAELATKEFLNLYNADSKNSTVSAAAPAAAPSPLAAAAIPAVPAIVGITARGYAEGVADATRNLKGAEQSAKLRELSAARGAGRNKGL
jgi:hypothetical protein